MLWIKSKLFAVLGGALALLMGVLAAFLSGRQSGKNEIKAKNEKKAREVEQMGYEAAHAGQIREREIRETKVKVRNEDGTKKRDYFE